MEDLEKTATTGHSEPELGDTTQIRSYPTLQDENTHGHLQRKLQSRHIQLIAIGGTIGTSLFLGIGSALTKAGPLSLLLGFTITGFAIWGVMQCLGEMATWLPVPGAIPQFCARYVDDALGFAVGWNNWYFCAIVLCLEIDAAAVVIDYWEGARGISPAVWISLLIVLVLFLNAFAVSIYGEAEFIFASIKIVAIIGLLILSVCIDLGGTPKHDRLGFRYWKHPGAMKELAPASGNTGRFLGFFSCLVTAAFTFGGIETVVVSAGETLNPRKAIPKAIRRVFWRILIFYVLGTLAVGVMVPYTDKNLLGAQSSGAPGAAQSPWVIAITEAGIPILPSIINAVILTSAASSANGFLYNGSRYLYALAQNKHAPSFLLKCTKSGIPIYCVGLTGAISLITYMAISAGGANVFAWFANIITVASLFTWGSVCIAFLRFRKAQMIMGLHNEARPFISKFQPYTAYLTLGFCVLIIVFNGFDVFLSGNWNVSNFLVAYIGIPIFFLLYGFWKLAKKSRLIPIAEIDILSGKDEIDQLEALWIQPDPKNIFEKVHSALHVCSSPQADISLGLDVGCLTEV
ncbi:hypothetical protein BP6252_13350 [Coleophoma cylindrospora]|uniref:Amino acid permease/ SLC12A domain-containing protein n=1 Tax=Coleophoma cylindrospora TaxID=1849047 RepID=A0A3D8QBN6_9HELO|nr:hypothetical protein BP6252_13350 [Coleophoma cylindrospora]